LSDRAISEAPTLDELLAHIREVFPRLVFSTAELIGTGDDNLVVVLDDEQIARFPRKAEYRGRFAAELNLLSRLAPISRLPVPRYERVSPDGSVGIYQRIKGREMTVEVFSTMTPADQRLALASLAAFLSSLHALPAETIVQPDGSIARTWSGERFAALYHRARRAEIAEIVSATTLARFDAFHDAFKSVAPGPFRLAHNDLTDDHILVQDGRITGIIDFSDAAFGDPAIDFAWFWLLGEANVDLVLRDYRFPSADASLKERAHWIFVRYLINQLWYGLRGKSDLTTDQTLDALEPHLKRLGF
jgi:aminoglycoside 2''-phosphotransferase